MHAGYGQHLYYGESYCARNAYEFQREAERQILKQGQSVKSVVESLSHPETLDMQDVKILIGLVRG